MSNPNTKPIPNQKIIDASFDRLVIYKNKRGKINQRIISFIPDESYLARHKYNINHNRIDKLDKDFDGYLHYKDWNGKALFILRIINGKPVKKYNMQNSVTGTLQTPTTSKNYAGDKNVMVVDIGGGGGNPPMNCYSITWDWYQECYYSTPESEFPYYCDAAVVYNVQYVEIPCPPGNGEGGGGGPSDPPTDPEPCLGVLIFETGECIEDGPPPQKLDSILKDTCLNVQQMLNLRLMFDSYLDGQGDSSLKCAQTAVYNKVKALGKKFGFCINADQIPTGGNASYRSGVSVIYYGSEEGLPNVGVFGHEFFHGFQDAFYPGGTTQYNQGTRTGFPNMEFEQALFYDIVNGSGNATAMGSTADPLIVQEYKNWINIITNNNTSYPKQFSNFAGQYYYFLQKFYNNANGYIGIGLMKTDLPPNALLNIFSSSNCK